MNIDKLLSKFANAGIEAFALKFTGDDEFDAILIPQTNALFRVVNLSLDDGEYRIQAWDRDLADYIKIKSLLPKMTCLMFNEDFTNYVYVSDFSFTANYPFESLPKTGKGKRRSIRISQLSSDNIKSINSGKEVVPDNNLLCGKYLPIANLITELLTEIELKKNNVSNNTHSDNNSQTLRPNDLTAEFKIFYGPPGTSKTTIVKERYTNGEFEIVQIHPSFGYEDLIEGLKPLTFCDGSIKYDIIEGPVAVMARKATGDGLDLLVKILNNVQTKHLSVHLPLGTCRRYDLDRVIIETKDADSKPLVQEFNCSDDVLTIEPNNKLYPILLPHLDQYKKIRIVGISRSRQNPNNLVKWGQYEGPLTLVLDEINRGHVASLLGELVFAISEASSEEPKPVRLQYSQRQFFWPSNMNLIGTMNSADTSTDKIDQAIKRRFGFEYVPPLEGKDLDGKKNLKIKSLQGQTIQEYFMWLRISENYLPGRLIEKINNLLRNPDSAFSVFNLKEKLVGHSYFIKYVRLVAESHEKGNKPNDQTCASIFKEIYKSDIQQQLLSILNNNHEELVRFEKKLSVFQNFEFLQNEPMATQSRTGTEN